MVKQIKEDMLRLESMVIVSKKNLIILLLLSLISLTSCSKRNDFFNNEELRNFGLDYLAAPENSSNYYNKSNNKMLFCYMTVSKDDDVIEYVLNALNNFQNNNIYKEFGYAKSDDMYKENRKIYMSNNIEDYQINSNNYSENGVSFNSYEIYYSLTDKTKEDSMYILTITSYTEKDTIYLTGYNLIISVVKKNYSRYTIVND